MPLTLLPRRALLLPLRQPSPLTASPLRSLTLRRPYSTQPPPPPSATGDFYKTFTRPVAKCLLLALLTYQITYWAWVKLEMDEIKMERTAEIAQLEEQVEVLKAAAEGKKRKGVDAVAGVVKGEGKEGGKVGGRGWWPF